MKRRACTVAAVALWAAVFATAASAAYGWPIKPFDAPHAIRGGFDDPRIAPETKDFHFGLDISAADGTPVYAVAAGIVYFVRPNAVGIRVTRAREFDYWHIVPVVPAWSYVAEHQLLGHVAAGWGHVHFAEIERGVFVNPLRPDALAPTSDHVPPTIDSVSSSGGPGGVDVVAEVSDVADLAPAAPWNAAVMMPALVRWRLEVAGRALGPWRVAVDFRIARLPSDLFDAVYARGTRQNEPNLAGTYRIYLVRGLDGGLDLVARESGDIAVEASDAAGNTTVRRFALAPTSR